MLISNSDLMEQLYRMEDVLNGFEARLSTVERGVGKGRVRRQPHNHHRTGRGAVDQGVMDLSVEGFGTLPQGGWNTLTMKGHMLKSLIRRRSNGSHPIHTGKDGLIVKYEELMKSSKTGATSDQVEGTPWYKTSQRRFSIVVVGVAKG